MFKRRPIYIYGFISVITFLISSIFLGELFAAEEPILIEDNIKKVFLLDELIIQKKSGETAIIQGSCGVFEKIVTNAFSSYQEVGVSVDSIQINGKKDFLLEQLSEKKGVLSIGDFFHKIICVKDNKKHKLIIESSTNMGSANEPEPTNYVFDADNGNIITSNCNEKCLNKYLKVAKKSTIKKEDCDWIYEQPLGECSDDSCELEALSMSSQRSFPQKAVNSFNEVCKQVCNNKQTPDRKQFGQMVCGE